jgi:predicted deacylase
MIHLPTVAGGRVEHLVRAGDIVKRGALLSRIHPDDAPIEEIIAPMDGVIERLRLQGQIAPKYARVLGLSRLVLASCAGRVRWIATLGPVGLTSMVALLESSEGAVRPHRAGAIGFVGRRFAEPGQTVEAGAPLLQVRGEELG